MKYFVLIILLLTSSIAHAAFFHPQESIDFLKQNPDDPFCAYHLSQIALNKYCFGNESTVEILSSFINRTSLGYLKESARSEKDNIEVLTGKRERSAYYDQGALVSLWEINTINLKYGYNDIFQSNPETGKKRNGKTNRFGIVSLSDYITEDGTGVFLKKQFHCDKRRILKLESNADYIIFSQGSTVINNTGYNRRDVRFLLLEPGTVDISMAMYAFRSSMIRAVLLDETFSPAGETDAAGDGSVKEMEDPVLSALIADKRTGDCARYLDLLNSLEAQNYYEASSSEDNVDYAEFLFRKKGAFNLQSGRVFSHINETANRSVDMLILQSDKALSEGRNADAIKLLNNAPVIKTDFRLQRKLISALFASGYYAWFSEEAERYLQKFPDDSAIKILFARYCFANDGSAGEKMVLSLLEKEYSEAAASRLLNYYFNCGRYDDLLNLIKKYNLAESYKITEAEALLLNGKKAEGRKKLMEILSLKEDSLAYSLLAQSSNEKENDIFFQKLLSIRPSDKSIAAYAATAGTLHQFSEFDAYRDKKEVQKTLSAFREGDSFTDDYPFRGEYVIVFSDRKIRTFKETLIYIKTDADADTFGEIRLPSGGSEIISAKVYSRDGSFTDSYRVNKTGSGNFLTIHGLRKDTMLHLTIESQNISAMLFGSSYICSSLLAVQEYWRSCALCSVKLINRSDTEMVLFNSLKLPVKTEDNGNETVYSFNKSSMKAVKREPSSGHYSKTLLYYAFWSKMSDADFFKAYYRNNGNSQFAVPKQLLGLSGLDEQIKNIYLYINRKIDTSGSMDFRINDYYEIMAAGKADAEDKTFLAKYFFDKIGVVSYFALVRENYADADSFYFDRFSAPLLLVVKPDGKKLWLDFSNRYYSAGTVSSRLEGETAIVFSPDIQIQSVTSADPSLFKTQWKISIPDNSFSFSGDCSGDLLEMAKYFEDSRYAERGIKDLLQMFRGDYTLTTAKTMQGESVFSVTANGYFSGIAIETGAMMLLNPFIRKSYILDFFTSRTRENPVVMSEPVNEEDHYEIQFPEKYREAEADIKKVIVFDSARAEYIFYKAKGSLTGTVTQKVSFPKMTITTERYVEFGAFCEELKNIEKIQVVLKRDGTDH